MYILFKVINAIKLANELRRNNVYDEDTFNKYIEIFSKFNQKMYIEMTSGDNNKTLLYSVYTTLK